MCIILCMCCVCNGGNEESILVRATLLARAMLVGCISKGYGVVDKANAAGSLVTPAMLLHCSD